MARLAPSAERCSPRAGCVYRTCEDSTYLCDSHRKKHVCGATCRLKIRQEGGVVCPVSRRWFERVVFNDEYASSFNDHDSCSPSSPSYVVDQSKSKHLFDEANAILRCVFQKVPRTEELDVRLQTYALEFARLHQVFSKYEPCSFKGRVLAFVYMMRDGFRMGDRVVVPRDDFVRANAPNLTELPRLGFVQGDMTAARHAVQTALQKMIGASSTTSKDGRRSITFDLDTSRIPSEATMRDVDALSRQTMRRDATLRAHIKRVKVSPSPTSSCPCP